MRQRQLDPLDDCALRQPDRVRRLRQHLARQRLRLGVEPVARDDALHEAVAVGRLRVDRVAGEDHLHRDAGRDVPRQRLRAAGGRDVAEADLRQAEPRVFGGDAEVAAHRQLDPGAESEAVDGGDQDLVEREHEAPEVALAAGAAGLDVRRRGAELADVGAGGEGAVARALEDDDAHVGVVADGVHEVPEVVAHLPC